ncbi:MAG: hypothetical protein U1E22_06805, partial [Coriobacteriia bacterium]|nr:hypothetical protein [Coriobacteriia bacterium]
MSAEGGQFGLVVCVALDLYQEVSRRVRAEYPTATVRSVGRLGGDALAFMNILATLTDMGYSAVCKLHVDAERIKSDHEGMGMLIEEMVGSVETYQEVVSAFAKDEELCAVGPSIAFLSCEMESEKVVAAATELVQAVEEIAEKKVLGSTWGFFAAGMLWYRLRALLKLAGHLRANAGFWLDPDAER